MPSQPRAPILRENDGIVGGAEIRARTEGALGDFVGQEGAHFGAQCLGALGEFGQRKIHGRHEWFPLDASFSVGGRQRLTQGARVGRTSLSQGLSRHKRLPCRGGVALFRSRNQSHNQGGY